MILDTCHFTIIFEPTLIPSGSATSRRTVVIASHNLTEVENLADRILFLENGAVKAAGTLQELKERAGISGSESLDTIFETITG